MSRSADVLDDRACQTLTSLIADVFPPNRHSPSAEDPGAMDQFLQTFLPDKGNDRQRCRSGPLAEATALELGWQIPRSPSEHFIGALQATDAACEVRHDPMYRDAWGDALLRVPFDWRANERRMLTQVGLTMDRALRGTGADIVDVASTLPEHWDTTQYQSSHASGGTIMGSDPDSSVVDADLQCWAARNLWIVGASVFPTNPAPNPTLTVASLAYRLAATLHHAIG